MKKVVLIGVIFLLPMFLLAQYNVRGKVIDKVEKEPLNGASVLVKETNQGAIADEKGKFILTDLSVYKGTLVISFLGYKSREIIFDLNKDKNQDINIQLQPESVSLNEFTYESRIEGQARAMNLQKMAENIKNVVSSEQIVKFPDINAAEVVQRIPGITIQRDQGEGKYIQLRGTAPEYTNFNVNGEQISSPEGGVRYVGLDVISADQIDMIEVTKVLTPDMDADGIAGNVNIVTKSATDTIPDIKATIAGGYNDLMQTNNTQLQFSFGQRYKKFGFQMNASHYENNQGSHNMEYDYTRGPLLSQAQSGDSTQKNYYILYSDVDLRHYLIKRIRTGLSANLDYKFNKNHFLYLRGMYNRYTDDEQRRRKKYGLSDANSLTNYREASIEVELKDRLKTQEISTVNFGGEHTFFGNKTKLDYEIAYALATDEEPNTLYSSFDNGGITLEIDKTNPLYPRITIPDSADYNDAMNYENYEFDRLEFVSRKVKDENLTVKMNIEIPYKINSNNKGRFKFGGKIRKKEKIRENKTISFGKYYEKSPIYSQVGPEINLAVMQDENFSESNLLWQGYDMGPMIDEAKIRDLYEKYPQNFYFDQRETWEETFGEDYSANEEIQAVYAMLRHDFRNFMFLGGVRYEKTHVDYQGYKAWIDYDNGALLYVDTIIKSKDYEFLLPQLQLKYSINNRTNIRAAATYSYSRPNFDDIIPSRKDDDNSVEFGTAYLEFPYSLNVDLLAEHYLPHSGILSGGLFYKRIQDIIFTYTCKMHEGENFSRFGLRDMSIPVNGIYADVYGAEIQTQFKFSFLPWLFKNFGFYGTYTFTESQAHIYKREPINEMNRVFEFNITDMNEFIGTSETEIVPLSGQAKHTVNAAFFYESKKLYLKISCNYHTPFLYALGVDKELDTYYDQSIHWDFNANYQITKSLNCFVDIINLSNQPLRYYMGSTDYFKQQEFYSWWGRIGLKIKV